MKLIGLIMGAASLFAMTFQWVQAAQSQVLDLRFTVESLQFVAEDIGGRVEGLTMEETETEIRVELSGDVLFDFDRADIRVEAEPQLAQLAELIRQHPGAGVMIEGHTDSKGADEYNLALSRRRADAVKGWLAAKGKLDAWNIATRGLGEANPVAPNTLDDGNDNPAGRQKNRRVQITVSK